MKDDYGHRINPVIAVKCNGETVGPFDNAYVPERVVTGAKLTHHHIWVNCKLNENGPVRPYKRLMWFYLKDYRRLLEDYGYDTDRFRFSTPIGKDGVRISGMVKFPNRASRLRNAGEHERIVRWVTEMHRSGRIGRYCRPVMNVTTGKVYASCKECAADIGVRPQQLGSNMSRACKTNGYFIKRITKEEYERAIKEQSERA